MSAGAGKQPTRQSEQTPLVHETPPSEPPAPPDAVVLLVVWILHDVIDAQGDVLPANRPVALGAVETEGSQGVPSNAFLPLAACRGSPLEPVALNLAGGTLWRLPVLHREDDDDNDEERNDYAQGGQDVFQVRALLMLM